MLLNNFKCSVTHSLGYISTGAAWGTARVSNPLLLSSTLHFKFLKSIETICSLLLMPLCGRLIRVIPPISLRVKLRPRATKSDQERPRGWHRRLRTSWDQQHRFEDPGPPKQLGRIRFLPTHALLPSQAALTTAPSASNTLQFFPREYSPGKQVPPGGHLRCYTMTTREKSGREDLHVFWREGDPPYWPASSLSLVPIQWRGGRETASQRPFLNSPLSG